MTNGYVSKFPKIKKIYNYIDYEIITNIDEVQLHEAINILEIYSGYGLGSPELYLALDKKLGINIDKIDTKYYADIVNYFIRSNNYREKFLLLMQKKIVENITKLSISDVCKILRMYAIVKSEGLSIFEKCYKHVENK